MDEDTKGLDEDTEGLVDIFDHLEPLLLPEAAADKLAAHENTNLLEALGHPLRRQILREVHMTDAPQSVTDLVDRGGPLQGAGTATVEHHAGLLNSHGVLTANGEVVTRRGTLLPLYLSTVARDPVVREVLDETADLDLQPGDSKKARRTQDVPNTRLGGRQPERRGWRTPRLDTAGALRAFDLVGLWTPQVRERPVLA